MPAQALLQPFLKAAKHGTFSALEKKQQVATAALGLLRDGMVLGVGTGSTVNALIDLLAPWRSRLRGAVSSSTGSTTRLQALGIPVFDLNEVPELAIVLSMAPTRPTPAAS